MHTMKKVSLLSYEQHILRNRGGYWGGELRSSLPHISAQLTLVPNSNIVRHQTFCWHSIHRRREWGGGDGPSVKDFTNRFHYLNCLNNYKKKIIS